MIDKTDKNQLFVLEIPVFNIDKMFECVKDFYETTVVEEIIKKAQNTGCDIIGLQFNIISQNQIPIAVTLLKRLLPLIKKTLMIRGTDDFMIDAVLVPSLINTLDRFAIAGCAAEQNYRKIVPEIIKGGHKLIIKTPIDINLVKEMNILTTDMGLSPEKIIIDPDIGGLGYGLEYGYSIMEKIRLANDEFLNMPMISFAGEESLKTKEAKSADYPPSYGDFKKRSIMFEVSACAAVMAAGAKYIVVNHPQTLKALKGLV